MSKKHRAAREKPSLERPFPAEQLASTRVLCGSRLSMFAEHHKETVDRKLCPRERVKGYGVRGYGKPLE